MTQIFVYLYTQQSLNHFFDHYFEILFYLLLSFFNKAISVKRCINPLKFDKNKQIYNFIYWRNIGFHCTKRFLSHHFIPYHTNIMDMF
jgi:hypothetical protein